MALGLACASLADEAAEQWAPATYESTGPTAAAAAAVPAASAPGGGSEYHVQQYNQYPPAAPQTPAQVRADPNGQLAAASMVRSMRDSLADISGRVGRGFSSVMGLNQEAFQSGRSTTRGSKIINKAQIFLHREAY